MATQVKSSSELKLAMEAGANEIQVVDESLAKQLRAIGFVKKNGPLAVGAIVAAIPVLVASGGLAAPAFAALAPGAAWSTTAIVGIVIAVGGTIAISLFTDWDYVEINGFITLKRRGAR